MMGSLARIVGIALTAMLCLATASTSKSSGGEREPLFDGHTLTGWTTLDGEAVTRGWHVVDGMIHLTPTEPRAGHIVNTHEFGDFKLSFDWKISAGGNSGVKYRVRKYGRQWRGLEYQLLDDGGYHEVLPLRKQTGALYDLYPPNSDRIIRSPGEFNSSQIVVQRNRVEHWLNGRLIVSATIGGDDWFERVADSKFAEYANFGTNERGRIMLTDHGSEVWFRNIKLEISYEDARSPWER